MLCKAEWADWPTYTERLPSELCGYLQLTAHEVDRRGGPSSQRGSHAQSHTDSKCMMNCKKSLNLLAPPWIAWGSNIWRPPAVPAAGFKKPWVCGLVCALAWDDQRTSPASKARLSASRAAWGLAEWLLHRALWVPGKIGSKNLAAPTAGFRSPWVCGLVCALAIQGDHLKNKPSQQGPLVGQLGGLPGAC